MMTLNEFYTKITRDKLENAHKNIPDIYLDEENILEKCLNHFPYNKEEELVALKCSIIDVTNSTNLSRHKKNISLKQLVTHIIKIKNIDDRIKNGDFEVVKEIANTNSINLFSFASKYCCYHSLYCYGRDNFSIYDNLLKEEIPKFCKLKEYENIKLELKNDYKCNFLKDVTENVLEKIRKNYDFSSYQKIIDKILEDIDNVENKRRKFDNYIWGSKKNFIMKLNKYTMKNRIN